MKSLLTVCAAALTIGTAVPALAQTEPAAPDAAATSGSQLTGSAVYDSAGQQVGSVDEVIVGADGSEQAVISVGGFLGLGSKKIAVPVSDLTPKDDWSGYTTAMTAEDIEAAPEHQPQ